MAAAAPVAVSLRHRHTVTVWSAQTCALHRRVLGTDLRCVQAGVLEGAGSIARGSRMRVLSHMSWLHRRISD